MGESRTVEQLTTVVGVVWYNPLTDVVVPFPGTQTRVVWTKNPTEGSPNDESIVFNDKDQNRIDTDVAVIVNADHDKVKQVFVTYRLPFETLVDGIIHDEVRNAINLAASKFTIYEILGAKKPEFQKAAFELAKAKCAAKGFDIQDLQFISDFRVDPKITEAITAKNTSIQAAAQANNQLAQRIAEGKAIVIKAQSEADANRALASSITPALIQSKQLDIQKQAIEKWNGVMPQVTSGGNSSMLFDVSKMVGK